MVGLSTVRHAHYSGGSTPFPAGAALGKGWMYVRSPSDAVGSVEVGLRASLGTLNHMTAVARLPVSSGLR